jgi:uroporphyrinogen decarboxylase
MRQAGRYLPEYREVRAKAADFLELCYTPVLAAELTLQPVRRFGMDAAILFSDILVVPDALGVRVSFREGEGPVLERLETAADIARLRSAGSLERLSPVLETVSRVRGALSPEVALIGFAGSPWTVATYMVEGAADRDLIRAKSWALDADSGFAGLIDRLVEATVAYLGAQIEAGADAVQLFDSWSGALPEDAFARWCIEPTRRIVERLHAAHPGAPVIGFPRGAGTQLERFVIETGVDAVSLDPAVSLAYAAEVLQPRATLQGNLDPVALLLGGRAMEASAHRILDALGGGPFVFNLGHGVLPRTPPEHVASLVALVRGR